MADENVFKVEHNLLLISPFQQSAQLLCAYELTACRVSSDRPIAVFSGNRFSFTSDGSVTSGSKDLLVEQLVPVAAWGTDILVPPMPLRTKGDILKIIGTMFKQYCCLTLD